jgi:hypothetical protein
MQRSLTSNGVERQDEVAAVLKHYIMKIQKESYMHSTPQQYIKMSDPHSCLFMYGE